MFPYYVIFLTPAMFALNEHHMHRRGVRGAWILTAGILIGFIGFRYEVGGDWNNYVEQLDHASGLTLDEALKQVDPAYALMNWVAARFHMGVWAVNLASAVIFCGGLFAFAWQQPRPWLALVISIPYLVVVVAMGYTRQAVAIGIILLAISKLNEKRSLLTAFLCILLASSFHRSAMVMLPLVAAAATKNKIWVYIWIGTTCSVVAVLMTDTISTFSTNYIEAEYQSEGAMIRTTLNAIPAAVLLMIRKELSLSDMERKFWVFMSVCSLGLLGVLAISPSSTAVDRIGLYMLPIQIWVFCRVPEIVSGYWRKQMILGIVLVYGMLLFGWLWFATHAAEWLPYRSYIWS